MTTIRFWAIAGTSLLALTCFGSVHGSRDSPIGINKGSSQYMEALRGTRMLARNRQKRVWKEGRSGDERKRLRSGDGAKRNRSGDGTKRFRSGAGKNRNHSGEETKRFPSGDGMKRSRSGDETERFRPGEETKRTRRNGNGEKRRMGTMGLWKKNRTDKQGMKSRGDRKPKSSPLSLGLKEFSISFVATDAENEPTQAQYEEIHSKTIDYLEGKTKSFFADYESVDVVGIESSLMLGRFGQRVIYPEPRFNIEMFFDVNVLFSGNSSVSDIEQLDTDTLKLALQDEIGVDYIGNVLRASVQAPFDSVNEIFIDRNAELSPTTSPAPTSAGSSPEPTPAFSGSLSPSDDYPTLSPSTVLQKEQVTDFYIAFAVPDATEEPERSDISDFLTAITDYYFELFQFFSVQSGWDFAGIDVGVSELKFEAGIPAEKFNVYLSMEATLSYSASATPPGVDVTFDLLQDSVRYFVDDFLYEIVQPIPYFALADDVVFLEVD